MARSTAANPIDAQIGATMGATMALAKVSAMAIGRPESAARASPAPMSTMRTSTRLILLSSLIASTNAHGMRAVKYGPTAAWVLAPVLSLILPGAYAMESPMMNLIIGFALWQAWKMNRRTELALVGPFALTPAAAAADAGATATSGAPEQSVA